MHSYLLAESEQLHPSLTDQLRLLDRLALRFGVALVRYVAERHRTREARRLARQSQLHHQHRLDLELEKVRRQAEDAKMLRPLF